MLWNVNFSNDHMFVVQHEENKADTQRSAAENFLRLLNKYKKAVLLQWELRDAAVNFDTYQSLQ